MQVVNFLKNPSLLTSPTVFAPIAGLKVHGAPMGHSPEEIIEVLKKQFKISEKIQYTDDLEITQVIENAKSILSNHFELDNSVVYIAGIDSSEEFVNKHLGGVSGYAWSNAVILYLNPDRKWPQLLLRTALHEFNHCQRYRFSDPYKSLLDWLIFEGLAESFESEMTQRISNFEKSRDLAEKYIPQLQEFWNQFPEDGYQWFFGDEKRNIPVGLGYSIGHYLVEKFRKSSPEMTWRQLVEIPSEEFVFDVTAK